MYVCIYAGRVSFSSFRRFRCQLTCDHSDRLSCMPHTIDHQSAFEDIMLVLPLCCCDKHAPTNDLWL